jgi:pyrroline-5-carboxylate reductase
MDTIPNPLLFIGGGNMAHAIISGASRSGTLDPASVGVIEPSQDRHGLYSNPFSNPPQALAWLDEHPGAPVIVLAVKPQMLDAAIAPLRSHLASMSAQPLVISILAGTRIAQIEQGLNHQARVIRVMPNTPAQIGLAMSAIAPSESATQSDIDLAMRIFSSIGKAITIAEDLMDAYTALAGSGPAYLFYLAEAMVNAAQQLGFDEDQAQTITRQTILGSASLLDQSSETPKALRAKVTSKNGTTQAATDTLDDSGVMDAFIRAIHAARHRGAELGQGDA